MNDINNKPVNFLPANRGTIFPTKTVDGKKLPIEAEKIAQGNDVTDEHKVVKADHVQQHLHDAVGSMNDFVQTVKRDLQFSVDKELNQTIIKVVDSNSGKLIRQIPEDVFLELARKVKESGQLNLLHATG